MRTRKIYIAGKVTGEPVSECSIKFGSVQSFYEAIGYKVVNPLQLVTDSRTDWTKAMKLCIAELLTCDAIVLLADWKNSKGAVIERQLAEDMKLVIVENNEEGIKTLNSLFALNMNSEQAKEWLEATVSDAFMKLFFYDRKGDEDMNVEQLRVLMDEGILSKETMIEVFTAQIEKEY